MISFNFLRSNRYSNSESTEYSITKRKIVDANDDNDDHDNDDNAIINADIDNNYSCNYWSDDNIDNIDDAANDCDDNDQSVVDGVILDDYSSDEDGNENFPDDEDHIEKSLNRTKIDYDIQIEIDRMLLEYTSDIYLEQRQQMKVATSLLSEFESELAQIFTIDHVQNSTQISIKNLILKHYPGSINIQETKTEKLSELSTSGSLCFNYCANDCMVFAGIVTILYYIVLYIIHKIYYI